MTASGWGKGFFSQLVAQRGYREPPDLYERLLGCTNDHSREVCKRALGAAFPYDEIMVQFYDMQYQVAQERGMPLKAGFEECMAGLKAMGIPCALATSTKREVVEHYIAHTPPMQGCFDEMVCGGEAGRSKPAPDIYLEAARRLGLSPRECVGVEDSFNGLRSLTAAGCVRVMIPDIIGFGWRFMPYVDHVLDDLSQLCGLIARR